MKCCGVILFVLAVFVCQNEASVSPVMSHLNETVQSVQNALQERKGRVAEEQNRKLQAFMENFRGIVSHSVATARKEFEGKGPECLTNLEGELTAAQNKVSPVLEKCLQNNTPDARPVEDRIDVSLAKGAEILATINEIEVECAGEKEIATRACIARRIPKVSVAVGVYLAGVGKLKGQVVVALGLSYAKIGKCIVVPLKDFKVEVEKAKRNARACVKAAQ
ncbi:uncharacterized protein LOC107036378 [Diachasma alloeum]|uniref:uncharacterized protein LOC107036378 n=1 Tax=Diachasma alloeum TaxID=454923 RepID=UPI0007381DDD|nr:uncharacterized protein LOC107036378 [Diachasma alloeum]